MCPPSRRTTRRFAASTTRNTSAASKTWRSLSRFRWSSGRRRRIGRARGNGRRLNGRPPRTSAQCYWTIRNLHDLQTRTLVRKAPMPFPVPRCCGDCARFGYLNASPRSALRRVPVAAGEKAAARAGAQDSSMRLNATTWSAHRKLQNRLGIQSGFRLRPPDQQAAATMPPHALTCPANAWCISPVRQACPFKTAKRRLSASANLRQEGVSHRRPNAAQGDNELHHCSAVDSANHAAGPTICLASA